MKRMNLNNQMIKLDPNKYILSVTDLKGNIIRVNDYFMEISQYAENELIGFPHNIIRHPDMPKAIFYLMWDHLKNNQNITAVVKNLAKDGRYYWVITHFEIRKDINGKKDRYMAFRYPASKKVINEIEPIYKNLLEIEKKQDMKESIKIFSNYLHKNGLTYNAFVENLKNKNGITSFLSQKFKKVFK